MRGLKYLQQFSILTVLELIEKEGSFYLAKKQMSAFHNNCAVADCLDTTTLRTCGKWRIISFDKRRTEFGNCRE